MILNKNSDNKRTMFVRSISIALLLSMLCGSIIPRACSAEVSRQRRQQQRSLRQRSLQQQQEQQQQQPRVDCSFLGETVIDDGLVLRTAVNTVDREVTVQLEYDSSSPVSGPPTWLGFGFSTTGRMMGTNKVVIGLAGFAAPAIYDLGGAAAKQNASVVAILPPEEQVLVPSKSNMFQNETHSILTFAQPLQATDNYDITVNAEGPNTFIYAVGKDDMFASGMGHSLRGGLTMEFESCRVLDEGGGSDSSSAGGAVQEEEEGEGGAAEEQQENNTLDWGDEDYNNNNVDAANNNLDATELDCGLHNELNLLPDGSVTMKHVTNPVDRTLTVEMSYEGFGWLSIGFSRTGMMMGSLAVIGLPDHGTVRKYYLGSKTNIDLMQPLPADQQTLTNTSIARTDTHTIMRFTRPLAEPGEGQWSLQMDEPNTLLYATGVTNSLTSLAHNHRNSFPLELVPCRDGSSAAQQDEPDDADDEEEDGAPANVELRDSGKSPNRKLWVAHGILMGLSWALFIPLAIGASLLRDMLPFPAGFWFVAHFFYNMVAVFCMTLGFILAVVATRKDAEAAGLEKPAHFSGHVHKQAGLVVFVVILLQVISGLLRPAAPPVPAAKEGSGGGDGDKKQHDGGEDDNSDDNTAAVVFDRSDGESSDGQGAAAAAAAAADSNQQRSSGTSSEVTVVMHATEKTLVRQVWEYKHRFMGLALLGAAWFCCDSGIRLLTLRFGQNYDKLAAFWGLAGGLSSVIAGHATVQFCLRRRKAAKERQQQQRQQAAAAAADTEPDR